MTFSKRTVLSWTCGLLVGMLSGCIWGGFYSLISDDEVKAGATLAEHEDHSCACVPDKTTKRWYWCDADGTRNRDGDYTCCGETKPDGSTCGKVCPASQGRKQPPVPVPLPPDCDYATHCKNTEKCALAPGKCCELCHQPC